MRELTMRDLPRLKTESREQFERSREEVLSILVENEYGTPVPPPVRVWHEVKAELSNFAAGKASLKDLTVFCKLANGKTVSFAAKCAIPKGDGPYPVFIHINFRSDVPDRYQPTEEIIDHGYAVFSFCYKDVAGDDDDFESLIAGALGIDRSQKNATGKLQIWAFAAMRLLDVALTYPEIDREEIAVVGHSRLGKTALLAGAEDSRFKYVISNDSGCGGAAISRGKIGESVEKITNQFPFWFCPKFKEYANKENEMPFDQHYLLALSVPRHVIVGSAKEDLWADPESEFLCLAAVNEVYNLYGMRGLVHDGAVPKPKTVLSSGESCYHIRYGTHYFSREDWLVYMDYIDTQRSMPKA